MSDNLDMPQDDTERPGMLYGNESCVELIKTMRKHSWIAIDKNGRPASTRVSDIFYDITKALEERLDETRVEKRVYKTPLPDWVKAAERRAIQAVRDNRFADDADETAILVLEALFEEKA